MSRPFTLLAAALLLVLAASESRAAEIKLLTGGAMKAVIQAVLPEFEKATGHKVILDNATAGALEKRIMAGEAFDVAVITPGRIKKLIGEGKVAAGSAVDLAKVGIGVAVKEGSARPDIATVDGLKAALLKAKSVAYIDPKAGGSSGIYFDKLLERLGIATEVRAKAKLKQGGYVADLVASGEAEIAVHQISEIVPVTGVVLVGPLPKEVQNFTTYTGAVSAAARDVGAATALVAFLASSAADKAIAARGMTKP